MAVLAPSDAVLLLPRVPASAVVGVDPDRWEQGLRRWGVDVVAGVGELAVVGARAARSPSAPTLLVVGRLRAGLRRRLEADGYRVASYAVASGTNGSTVVRPATGWRATVHVADRRDARPAALAASGQGTLDVATFADDQRRRAALRTGEVVVKVERERVTAARGVDEQAVLVALHDRGAGALVPRPHGAGVVGGVGWSAESVVAGQPLEECRDIDVYDRLGAWLLDLALATRADRADAPGPDDLLPLRGDALALLGSLPSLAGVPSIVVHGDLATGVNVLVDGSTPSVIDWETARWAGLPLADLVPLLCLGSARVEGCRTIDDEAAHVLALCRGRGERSAWLFDHVGRHLDALGVPHELAGTLAALAWASLASMRLVYLELVPGAADWRTASDIVATAWSTDPALGPSWPALAEHLARA